jgi:starch synthase (maltosyl-transferring)
MMPKDLPKDVARRVVISGVTPEVDGGRYPVKRVVGERVVVLADLFGDGHDLVAGELLYRPSTSRKWSAVPMTPLGNDRFRAEFTPSEIGLTRFTLKGWIDRFGSWQRDLAKRVGAKQDVTADLTIGAGLVAAAARRARGAAAKSLRSSAAFLGGEGPLADRTRAALDEELRTLVTAWPDRSAATRYDREVLVDVERERAGFSAWYELFPRSTAPEEGRHGTFDDLIERLPTIAEMGFDIVYLPPVHPIGQTHRKGANNNPVAKPGEIGSPWAIGSAEGGHQAVHPDLGTLEDFDRVVARARELELDIALDIAFQCSPDHPWATEHPEWFKHRPDGTIQYAENPPKKYEDIYPFDFECEDAPALWEELKEVVLFWAAHGVGVFRVDNPHTKPFAFWVWLIRGVRDQYPETIFLAEAFTRPRVMEHLGKIGFTQSYTYFTWRDTPREMREYLTELTRTPMVEYYRPNFWPNTPDILPAHLQDGGRPAFLARLVLAGTLSSCYGMYGPVFELLERVPRERGSEEYLNSEKYQLRHWDLDREDSLRPVITRLNRIRKGSPALHGNRSLTFHETTNDAFLVYSKASDDGENVLLVVVNMDPNYTHSGWVELDLGALGLAPEQSFVVHDLLSDDRFTWRGGRNFVELNPHVMPAHIFRIHPEGRDEKDFEYYGD